MSASGVGPFGNDSAMDLLDELRVLDESEVIDVLREALLAVTEVEYGEYLDHDLDEPAVVLEGTLMATSERQARAPGEAGEAGVAAAVQGSQYS